MGNGEKQGAIYSFSLLSEKYKKTPTKAKETNCSIINDLHVLINHSIQNTSVVFCFKIVLTCCEKKLL